MFDDLQRSVNNAVSSLWQNLVFRFGEFANWVNPSPSPHISLLGLSGAEAFRIAKLIDKGGGSETNTLIVDRGSEKSNREYCRSVLAAAIDGVQGMRELYGRERLTSMKSMPPWIAAGCEEICSAELKRFRPEDYVSRSMRRGFSIKIECFEGKTESLHAPLLLDAFLTTQARKDFHNESKFEHFSGKLDTLENLRWSVVDKNPLANHARKAFLECANFIHAVRIALDFGDLIHFEIPQATIENLARGCRNAPWEILETEYMQRLETVANLLEMREEHVSSELRAELFSKCSLQAPRYFMPELKVVRSPVVEQPRESLKDRDSSARQEAAGNAGQNLFTNAAIDALQARLQGKELGNREIARDLYKAIKRGSLKFDETLTALKRGLSARELLLSIPQEADPDLGGPAESKSKTTAPQQEAPAIKSDGGLWSAPALLVERSPRFEQWLASISDELTVSRIERRLNRLAGGNFGDCKTVRGGVIELREDMFRIYLRRIGEDRYRVINAGDKHSQDRDIDDCQAL